MRARSSALSARPSASVVRRYSSSASASRASFSFQWRSRSMFRAHQQKLSLGQLSLYSDERERQPDRREARETVEDDGEEEGAAAFSRVTPVDSR
jgi:hypothetical protein